jgi:hypothetical protein
VKLSMTEYMVLVDALTGSLRICDGGNLFHYDKESRQNLWIKLHNVKGAEEVAEVATSPEEDPCPKSS